MQTNSTEPPFVAFDKIPRLRRNVIVSEKIDGTNAIVWIGEDFTTIRAGSRSRWITPEDDNYGFARWVAANRDELLKLGPGYHYGEWWGAGIQRRYGLDHKRFSLLLQRGHHPLVMERASAPHCGACRRCFNG